MPRTKKSGESLHCYIRMDIMKELNDFIKETGYSKTVTVEKALTMFLEEQKKNLNI